MVLAVSMAIAWIYVPSLDSWAPNIAISAATIAVTITIIDRILRRAKTRGLLPRVGLTMFRLKQELGEAATSVLIDYRATHRPRRPIPPTWVELLALWLDSNARGLRVGAYGDRLDGRRTVDDAFEPFVWRLTGAAANCRALLAPDREVLDPVLIWAGDNWLRVTDYLATLFEEEREVEPDHELASMTVAIAVDRLRILIAVVAERETDFGVIPDDVAAEWYGRESVAF
jgi:hypothetical protein